MFFVPIPRVVAKERGLRFYLSGTPCKHNNITNRRVNNSNCLCLECNQERSLYTKNYREKYPEQCRETFLKWCRENPEKKKESVKKAHKKRSLHYLQNKRQWRENNRPKVREYQKRYKTTKLNATPTWYSELDSFVYQECQSLALLREGLLNFNWHVDHMIPLQNPDVCGLHVWNNFQCLPQVMNNSKSNKLIYTNPHEWLYDIPKFFKVVHQQEIAA